MELVDKENQYHLGQLVRETTEKRLEAYLKEVIPVTRTTVSDVSITTGSDGSMWESIRISVDMEGFEEGTKELPRGIELEIRLYKNVKKIEFKYMARKLIVTDPESLYVVFPFKLPGSRIVFETTGGTLTQGEQLPGSASDWVVAQNFVAVRGEGGQIIVVSDEIPLWHFSDFNINKFERYPKRGKPWLYSWVMNNYWMTNFRAYQEGGFSWSYQLTSTSDTTNAFATKYAWSERNPFLTRAFPAGANQLDHSVRETLKISGSDNAMLINCRPLLDKEDSFLLHFRELEGLPAEVNLSSALNGLSIKKIVEVNVAGKQIGQPLNIVKLKPYEVRFIEVEF